MKFARTQLACAALAVLGASAIAGCGSDVPSGSVAKVGDATIKKADFDKWLKSAAQGSAQGGAASVPDPPSYSKCVAAKSAQPAPQGTKKPDAAALKKQCRQEYDQLKGDVMQFLIQAQWVQQEAASRGVKVSDQEVKNRLTEEKKRAFPGKGGEKKYQAFLKTSGMNEEDILFRFKLETLQQKLTQKVTEEQSKVTDADVQDYYDKNKKRFAQPERRDLNVVLTKGKAKAQQAKKALQGGQSFKTVAKKYSIDQASKSQGGKLPDVAEGQQEKAFNAAIFSAKKGKLQGPRQDAVRLLRVQGHEGHAGLAAVARPVEGHDQEPAQVAAPAEGARQVHQGLPHALQGQDRLRRRLPGGRVQERAEGEDRHRPGLGRRPGAQQARSRALRSRGAPAAGSPAGPHPSRCRRSSRLRSSRLRSRPPRARRRRPCRSPSSRLRWRGSTRSPGSCAASAPGTASRTSARSCRTPSRRPTSWPTRRTRATTPSSSTSSATCSSRSTSCRCCSRSAAPATWPRWPSTAARS